MVRYISVTYFEEEKTRLINIYAEVIWPVAILSAIAAIVVYLNQHISSDVTLPTSIVSTLQELDITIDHLQLGLYCTAPLSRGMPKSILYLLKCMKDQLSVVYSAIQNLPFQFEQSETMV